MSRLIVAVVVALGLAPVPAAEADPDSAWPGHSGSPPPSIAGYYFGTTQSEWCRCGWLLRLDDHGGGALYAPPGTVRVVVQRRGGGDSISFVTVEDQPLSFVGTAVTDGLYGTFRRQSRERSGSSASVIALKRLSTRLVEMRSRYAGVYSNSFYYPESGDRVGYDIVFIPVGAGRFAVIATDFPGFSPQPAGEIVPGTRTTLSIRTYDGTHVYRPEFRDGTVVLKSARGYGHPPRVMLRRQRTLSELLR